LAKARIAAFAHDNRLQFRRIPPFRYSINGPLVANRTGWQSDCRACSLGLNSLDGLLTERLRLDIGPGKFRCRTLESSRNRQTRLRLGRRYGERTLAANHCAPLLRAGAGLTCEHFSTDHELPRG